MSVFTNEDYNSNNGFLTSVWGPLLWNTLHIISFNYPVRPTEADKENYYQFIISLSKVIPCGKCRENVKTNLEATNFNKSKLKNRDTFSRFVYDLHNVVNRMLKKPNYLTYEAIRDRYELFRARCVDGVPTIPVHNKELGCIVPLNNVKTQCMINIVPYKENIDSFNIDKKCIPPSHSAPSHAVPSHSAPNKSKGGSKKKSSKRSKKRSKKQSHSRKKSK